MKLKERSHICPQSLGLNGTDKARAIREHRDNGRVGRVTLTKQASVMLFMDQCFSRSLLCTVSDSNAVRSINPLDSGARLCVVNSQSLSPLSSADWDFEDRQGGKGGS